MHVYAVNVDKRRKVIVFLAAFDIILSAVLEYYGVISRIFSKCIDTDINYYLISRAVGVIIPISIYTFSYYLFDTWIWRFSILKRWHKVPDFNGHWEGTIESPLKADKIDVEAEIVQTWNRILIKTLTHSFSSSQ